MVTVLQNSEILHSYSLTMSPYRGYKLTRLYIDTIKSIPDIQHSLFPFACLTSHWLTLRVCVCIDMNKIKKKLYATT